jgi:hypothetical protein
LSRGGSQESGVEDESEEEEEERSITIEAGKSFGGRIGKLAEALESIWKSGVCCDADDVIPPKGMDLDLELEEIMSLLTALVLYRSLFPSSTIAW